VPQASEVVPFSDAMAPQCSQCQTKMVLETVEPHPVCSGKDIHTYRCKTCGLADQIEVLQVRPETSLPTAGTPMEPE
jgi:transcription elongation factor Elf1